MKNINIKHPQVVVKMFFFRNYQHLKLMFQRIRNHLVNGKQIKMKHIFVKSIIS